MSTQAFWRKLPGLDRRPVVAMLRLSGPIGQTVGWRGGLTAHGLDGAIERAFQVRRLAAVALAINSPGGLPVQAAAIMRRIRWQADKRKIPVLGFAEDVAASGGYMLALAADEFFVDENSIVGSIGVISAGFGFADAIARLGIERRLYTAGSRKNLLDSFQPENPEGVARLKELQAEIHTSFKTMVRDRRGDRLKGDDADLFNGDIWTGAGAVARGLADGLGDADTILRQRFGPDVVIRRIAIERRSWLRRFVPGAGASTLTELAGALEERLAWARFGL